MPKIHEVITEETWCQNVLIDGDRRCLVQWISDLYPCLSDSSRVFSALEAMISEMLISQFNNTHTFAEVLEVCKKADV
jgi:hypothetical protein